MFATLSKLVMTLHRSIQTLESLMSFLNFKEYSQDV